jgi:hypothetical protein
MKYIKQYETLNIGQPKVGNYVLCEEISSSTAEYTKNNIGKIIFIIDDDKDNMEKYRLFNDYKYIIWYEHTIEIPRDEVYFNGCCRRMKRAEIKYWSKNKRDLQAILKLNKYNL